ncbi:MAG: ABC transporter permease [Treponema sp.]|nr:ABC transporter permease [Treponema sp.]
MNSRIFALALFLCVLGLCITALAAQKGEPLLMVLPSGVSTFRFSADAIEEFSQTEFLLSYGIESPDRVSLHHGEYPLHIVATNSYYPFIMGLSLREGSFFSSQAWSQGQRHGVLNEGAAFSLYGSLDVVGNRFRMHNETWIVTGVLIDHEEDHPRVYIPSSTGSSFIQGSPLVLRLPPGTDRVLLYQSLRSLGLREGGHTLIDFPRFYQLLWERALLVLLLFFALLLLWSLIPLIKNLKRALDQLGKMLRHRYLGDLLAQQKKVFLRPLVFLGLSLLAPAGALFSFLTILSFTLPWQDLPSLSGLQPPLFYPSLDTLRRLLTWSSIFFWAALSSTALFFSALIFGPKKASS